jgi:hypothetical protein
MGEASDLGDSHCGMLTSCGGFVNRYERIRPGRQRNARFIASISKRNRRKPPALAETFVLPARAGRAVRHREAGKSWDCTAVFIPSE